MDRPKTVTDTAVRLCSRLGAPLDERSRSDRGTCSVTCRAARWRATEARRRPIPAPGDQGAIPAATDPETGA
jgi:hypothetical protein